MVIWLLALHIGYGGIGISIGYWLLVIGIMLLWDVTVITSIFMAS